MTTYVIATIVCLFMAFGVYILAQDEERTGPPQGQATQAGQPPTGHPPTGLPEGHPQTGGVPSIETLNQRAEELRQVLKDNSEDYVARLTLANLLYDLGSLSKDPEHFKEALGHYKTYLESHPTDVDARTDMAYVVYMTGDVNGSIKELQTVRSQDPKHQHSAFNLGLMYKEKDMPDSVLAYMAIAAQIDSTTKVGQAAAQVLQAYHHSH